MSETTPTDLERLIDETPMTLHEAASALGVEPATVRSYASRGLRGIRLETFRVGHRKTTVQAVRRFRLAVARASSPPAPEEYQRAHQRRVAVRRSLEEEGL